MINIKLTNIGIPDPKNFLNSNKTLLYADFNVLNYFFENRIKLPEDIIAYPDSMAVYFCMKYLLKKNIPQYISTDLQGELLNLSNESRYKVFFFGDHNSILNRLVDRVEKEYPGIKICGIHNGYNYETKNLVELINKSEVDILFIGLGVRRQEKWIMENFEALNSKFIISVGGWFQYLAENKKRAPKLLRDMHLEWLHKLIVEFSRVWKRYLFGVPLFFYRIITKKIVLTIDEIK